MANERLKTGQMPTASVVQDMTNQEKEAMAKGSLKRKAEPRQMDIRESQNLMQRRHYAESDDEEDAVVVKRKKGRKLMMDSDEDSEF